VGRCGEIRAGAAELAAILAEGTADLAARAQPARWSPLEYACHVRDLLLVQSERRLAARCQDRPRGPRPAMQFQISASDAARAAVRSGCCPSATVALGRSPP
jgi:hypothetical protein